MQKIQLSY